MSKMQKFKEALAKLVGECFAQVTTDKGVLRWETDEDLKAGDAVFYINENGEPVKPEDGDYKTEDGKVIRVADGKVVEIVDNKAEVSEEGKKKEKTAEEPTELEARVAELEGKFADLEGRLAKAEERIAEHRHDEVMSEVKKEVAELRSKLAKVSPKGIAQQFEEQEETKPNPTAKLAQLRAEALK